MNTDIGLDLVPGRCRRRRRASGCSSGWAPSDVFEMRRWLVVRHQVHAFSASPGHRTGSPAQPRAEMPAGGSQPPG